MRATHRILSALAVTALIGGCVAYPANIIPMDSGLSAEDGCFVVSVAHTGATGSMLLYRAAGSDALYRVDSSGFWAEDRDFGDRQSGGRVTAVLTPPGDYEVTGFGLYDDEELRRYFSKDLPRLTFGVNAGECVYIGRLRVSAVEKETFIGFKVLVGATAHVRDKSERDIQTFRDKFPGLRGVPLRKAVLDDSRWEGKRRTW